MNWYRGERISRAAFVGKLNRLNDTVAKDKSQLSWRPYKVVAAIDKLIRQPDLLTTGVIGRYYQAVEPEYKQLITDHIARYRADGLHRRIKLELEIAQSSNRSSKQSSKADQWDGTDQKNLIRRVPKGVIFHIAAGNNPVLPFFNLLDGLLTGNINLLKISTEDKLTTYLIERLVAIAPQLKPYIYCTDIPSTDPEALLKLAQVADVVSVWGSNQTIQAVRQWCPVSTELVEWSNRIGIVYLDMSILSWRQSIDKLIHEMVVTGQRFCGSPQIIFYNQDSGQLQELIDQLKMGFEKRNADHLKRSLPLQAGVTVFYQTLEFEAALGRWEKVVKDDNHQWAIICTSLEIIDRLPGWGTIYLVPVTKQSLAGNLALLKGELQTGCIIGGGFEIEEILIKMGINQIQKPGQMYQPLSPAIHDGRYMLHQFTRVINKPAGIIE